MNVQIEEVTSLFIIGKYVIIDLNVFFLTCIKLQ